jgi:hypothetical protein
MNADTTETGLPSDLYPALSDDELREAEHNLRRYFQVAWEIQSEQNKASADAEVDKANLTRKIKERSNVYSQN